MISEIIIPDLGASGGDVTLQDWLVKVGEKILAGQPLFIVLTDKATVEVEAFRAGVIREIMVEAGESVSLGSVVALLADSIDEPLNRIDQTKKRDHHQAQRDLARGTPLSNQEIQIGGRVLATPLARRMAKQEGVDLDSLVGSGAQGQVLKRDVIAALEIKNASQPNEIPENSHLVPLSPMQRAVAERTQRSKFEIPHYYATITVDMSAAQDLRQKISEWFPPSSPSLPSITDVCLRALALALKEYPNLNASFHGDNILYHDDINLGMVIGLVSGMLVPVIRQADRLNLFEIAAKTKQLKQHAQAGQLKVGEMGGGTFTLTNLGMFGLDSFTAVINPPEAGILALGAVKEQPTGINDTIVLRPLMVATLSVDHRVVDGITAARFLQYFKNLMENPIRLIMDSSQVS